jgi:hypothetical protein
MEEDLRGLGELTDLVVDRQAGEMAGLLKVRAAEIDRDHAQRGLQVSGPRFTARLDAVREESETLVFGEQDWSAWEWTPANTATASAELSRSSGMTEPGRGPIPARPTRG